MEEFLKQGEDWTLESAEARLSELLKNNPSLCFCLELDGETIGLVFAETYKHVKGSYLWISELVIKEEQQGKGYGLKTLQFMENLAKENGFNVLVLAANVKEKAFKIYEKFGFKSTGYCFMEKGLQ